MLVQVVKTETAEEIFVTVQIKLATIVRKIERSKKSRLQAVVATKKERGEARKHQSMEAHGDQSGRIVGPRKQSTNSVRRQNLRENSHWKITII